MPKMLAGRPVPLLTDEQITSGSKPSYHRVGKDRSKVDKVLLNKRTKTLL